MRVCIIGHFVGNLDEGFTNISSNLARRLRSHHEVMIMDTKDVFSLSHLLKIRKHKPQIVHQIAGPSLRSFLSLKLIKLQNGGKSIMSALHSESLRLFSKFYYRGLVPLLRPDLMLVQSNECYKLFTQLGCKVEFLPNGVDIEKFIPASRNKKLELRDKYGIPREKFVILHVGHFVRGRNLWVLKEMQNKDNQVVIVASTHMHSGRIRQEEICYLLKKHGCIILKGYFKNIEEIYQLSDCYVFPVFIGNSLFMPLSVLEAMSCNLPIITTKFEGLTTFFEEEDGLLFVNREEELLKKVEKIKTGNMRVRTREKVLPYSWENIIVKLNDIYSRLLQAD